MSKFATITAADWRTAIARARSTPNSISEQIRKQLAPTDAAHAPRNSQQDETGEGRHQLNHMNTENDWIKMTDRRPTEADLPVWVYDDGEGHVIRGPQLYRDSMPFLDAWTHWKSADIPAPPPREETQEEGDYAALVEWGRDENIQPLFTVRKTWHAAIAYERAEVAKLLPRPHSLCVRLGEYEESTAAIRARCAGGGK